jgi:hypothetical protein
LEKKGIVSVNWVYVRNISFQIISQLRVDLRNSFYKLGFFKKLFFFKLLVSTDEEAKALPN